jgi:hypothetical protein
MFRFLRDAVNNTELPQEEKERLLGEVIQIQRRITGEQSYEAPMGTASECYIDAFRGLGASSSSKQ